MMTHEISHVYGYVHIAHEQLRQSILLNSGDCLVGTKDNLWRTKNYGQNVLKDHSALNSTLTNSWRTIPITASKKRQFDEPQQFLALKDNEGMFMWQEHGSSRESDGSRRGARQNGGGRRGGGSDDGRGRGGWPDGGGGRGGRPGGGGGAQMEEENRAKQTRRKAKAAKKKRPRQMPAAKLNPKEFKTKGPLVLQAAYRGDIKHQLDQDKSVSLRNVKFDTAQNSIVLIGTEIEKLEGEKIVRPDDKEKAPQLKVLAPTPTSFKEKSVKESDKTNKGSEKTETTGFNDFTEMKTQASRESVEIITSSKEKKK
ncbi:hypothetical protein ANCCEY_04033 [Ancylostoma ceylanicum]|uniref:Uncharacterized protein n=1 Tax=Ancylostoma ceylanicum TaxID=53326 RepID=A0A0D6MAC4_9BILA|nr:hypothetical protein ANCCEY_04033 [Ancylostoma ceylanicum]